MDIRRLSDADKYMLYGLLLRKKRPTEVEMRVLEIMRCPLSLDQKIDAILKLHRELPGAPAEQEEEPPSRRRKRRLRAVVADPHPEVTRLLAKCSLRRELEFFQGEDPIKVLYLVHKLRARLVVCNLPLPPEARVGFARECRSRQSRIGLIFLASAEEPAGEPALPSWCRLLPKPINLNQVSEAARELLDL